MNTDRLEIAGAYGGDQNWFPRRRQRITGCGAVAACNMLALLGAAPADANTREGYLAFMQALYRKMRPGWLGMWSVRRWTAAVVSWAAEQGLSLQAERCSFRESPEACGAFLRRCLAQDRPVAALNLRKGWRRKYPYDWHWIVITDLRGDRMTFSSWGRQLAEPWSNYVRLAHGARWKGALVSFETTHSL